jgi:16S rRNA processing protein RimM
MQRISEPDELIVIGKIVRAVGLEGLSGIEPFGNTLETIDVPCTIKIGKEVTKCIDITLEDIEFRPNVVVCQFKDIHDRTAAEFLNGNLLYIRKCDLPVLEKGEYYHFELIGMTVYADNDTMQIGTVSNVHNFPSADTIEINRFNGDSLLVPLVGQSVVKIDNESKCIILRFSFIEELL